MSLKLKMELEKKRNTKLIEKLDSYRLDTDLPNDNFPLGNFKNLEAYINYKTDFLTKLINKLLEYSVLIDMALNQKPVTPVNNEIKEEIENHILNISTHIFNETDYVEVENHIFDFIDEECVQMINFLNEICPVP